MNITFSAEGHEYRADGRLLTPVTTILKAVGFYDTHEYTDPKHKLIGSAVHKVCQLIDSGRYDADQTHEEIRPFGEAYRRFAADTGFKGLFWECGYGDPKIGVGGTFDTLGRSDGEFWLVDFKSGGCPDLVPVQLAAYEGLIESGVAVQTRQVVVETDVQKCTPLKKKALRLEASGKYTLLSRTKRDVPYDDPKWQKVWWAAVVAYRIRKEYGRL